MRRLRDDRGAVSVVVALLMIPLIGFAAISVDIAAMWAQRQQLQSGADAAALAVAQDCARGQCGSPGTTAQTLTADNAGAGALASVVTSPLSPSTGRVTVRTEGTRIHVFAPLVGASSSSIATQATARWGAPSGGLAKLPLIFSWCEFAQQTDGGLPSGTTERVIKLTKSSGTTGCTGPSNNVVPGGFGWLKTEGAGCMSRSEVDGVVNSDPGNSVPASCDAADFAALQGRTVLLPLFEDYGGNGNNAWYRVHGYAAFRITGYDFAGQFSTNPGACTGNDRCITGYFSRFVDLTEAFETSATAPRLGASVLSLTE